MEIQNSINGTYTVSEAVDPNAIEPLKVDLAKTFDLSVGKSYQTTFTIVNTGTTTLSGKLNITSYIN